MASLLQIPQADRDLLVRFFFLDSREQEQFLTELQKVEGLLSSTQLAEQLQGQLSLSSTELTGIARIISSLFFFSDASSDHSEAVENLVEAVVESIRSDLVEESEPEKFDLFKAFLIKVLSIDALRLGAKGLRLMTQHEHVYRKGEIFTDVRPVFGLNGLEPPKAAVVVHTLKIEHFNEHRRHTIYLALDRDDLLQLQEKVGRALEKHRLLKDTTLKQAELRLLEPKEDPE